MTDARRERRWPLALLAFALALCAGLFLCLWTAHRALTDRDVWLDTAAETAPERAQRLESALREVAEAYEADPETLLGFFPPERVRELTRKGMAWLLGQWRDPPPVLPEISLEGLREALREQGLAGGMATNAVHDTERAAKRSLFPVRTTVAVQARALAERLGLGDNLDLAVRTAREASHKGIWITAGLALILCAAILLLPRRRGTLKLSYAGAGLAGGGLGALLLHLAVLLLNLPGRVGEVSELLGRQTAAVQTALLTPGLWASGGLFALGMLLMICLRDTLGWELNLITRRDRSGRLKAPLTVAFVSDLHDDVYDDILPHLRGADAILIAGDMTDRHSKKPPRRAEGFLRAAAGIAPTYLSIGNHERRMPGAQAWRAVTETTGVTVLDNAVCRLREDVALGGLSSQKKPVDAAVVQALAREDGFRLLLCHHPEYFVPYVKDADVELTLSGHAHGGQIRLFGRGLFAPGQVFFPRLTSGFYEDGRLLVSWGLASHNLIPPRINNPCELIILTLLPAEG